MSYTLIGLASLTSQPQWIFEEMTKQIRLLNRKVKEGKHREGIGYNIKNM